MTYPVFQSANNEGIYSTFLYYLSAAPQLTGVTVLFGAEHSRKQTSAPSVVVYPVNGIFNGNEQGYVRLQNAQVEAIWSTTEYLHIELWNVSRKPNAQSADHKDAVMSLQARVMSALYVQRAQLFGFEPIDLRWNIEQGATSQRGASKTIVVALNIPIIFEPLPLADVEKITVTPVITEVIT